jgi:aminopeptidase N
MKLLLSVLTVFTCIINANAQQVNSLNTNKHNACSHAKIKPNNVAPLYVQSNLMSRYDVKHVKLDLSMERTNTYVAGNATLLLQVTATSLDTIALELLQAITVDSVKVNNVLINNYTHVNNHVYTPCNSYLQGTMVSIQVFYNGTAPNNGFFSGVTNDPTNGGVTWTLSESFQGRDWWPCKQILSDKIDSVDVWITTDTANKVGSNGLLKNITPMGAGKHRYEWHSSYMINYYLISASIAKYIEYNVYAHPTAMAGDSILIQNYLYDNNSLITSKASIDKTATYIEQFSDAFGLYPFWKEKYGHCQTELGGGEEHQTMTTIGFFFDDLVDHELGHQWWGDNVTCATWQDIFINEGFASYCEQIGLERTGTALQALNQIKAVQNAVISQPSGSVYVPFASAYDENRIFDGRLSYDKGSAIIHMMRFEAQNDSLFFKALQNFQTQFKDSVATGEDLKTVLQNTIGISYADFFNQWYYGEGYPNYGITWAQANDTLTLTVNQTTSAAVTPLFKMLMEYKLKSAQGDTIVKGYQSANTNEFKYKLNGKTITQIVVDPNFKVLKKVISNIQITDVNRINKAFALELFPNPVRDKLYLSIEGQANQAFTAQVTDISGRIIIQTNNINFTTGIDVSALSAGAYLLKVNNANASVTKRFSKL